MRLGLAASIVLVGGIFLSATAGSRNLYSWTEASGNQHPDSVGSSGSAKVTCYNVAPPGATCFVTGPGVGQQVPQNQNVNTTGAGAITLTCNGSGALRCWARVDGPVAAERTAVISPKVQAFIKPLEGHESASGSIPDFYFRKETLQVNGALIIGNGGPNFYQAACTTSNKVALVLAKIDHFDDVGPCPSGGTLVRAVLK